MIRRATDADLAPVLRLAGRMWGAAPALRDVPLDSERVANVAYRLVAAGTLLVADIEPGADPVGFFAFIVAPNAWTGVLEATEVALYVAPERRGEGHAAEMLRVAELHARDAGALHMVAGTSLGDPSQAAVVAYARAGFAETGRTYRKALTRVATAVGS